MSGPAGWSRGRGWGWVWGPDDEVGALNALTDASRLRALRDVRSGSVYDLGVTIDRGSYLAAAHARTEILPFRTPDGLMAEGGPGFEDADGVSFNTSMITLSDHAGTQLDGLCHATSGTDRHWYNGYDAARHGSDFGPTRAGAHNIPPIVVPGTMLDVAGLLGVDELPRGHHISRAELAAARDAQTGDIEPGGVVLIRTGAMRHWSGDGHDHAAIAAPDAAGITLDAARWLVEEVGAVVVGADNSTVEAAEPVKGDRPSAVHEYLLVEQGVHMGELHDLEALARDDVHRFCYIALAPKVRGTTAGFALRPIAVV